MRIGILSLALHTNYGGILQAYALQTVLERMGHEVVIISRNFNLKNMPLWKIPLSITKRFIRRFLFCQNVDIFFEYHQNKTYRIISQHTQKFINQYIHTLTVNKLEELNEKDFDCIIVGSDQVWRKKYFTYHYATTIDNAYLAFAKDWNVKKMAYAASFGTEDWEYNEEETKKCKKLIKLFLSVSVREDSGVKLCKEKYGIEAIQLLDPTLLLKKEDYIKLFKDKAQPSPGNLMVYILDENQETDRILSEVIKQTNLRPFRTVAKRDSQTDILKESIQPPLESWLRGFYDAEFIVTDSFHACVFSIIFNKPFIVIGNESRGMARFSSFLKQFDLEDHLITTSEENVPKQNLKKPNVQQQILALQDLSFSYLKNSLE